MPAIGDIYSAPNELILGTRINDRVSEADQRRQRHEADEILERLRTQPGVVLADEVGMGKTFVALAIAYSIAIRSPRGPAIVMAPANLIDKWEQDFKTFCELYLQDRRPARRDAAHKADLKDSAVVRYGIARHSIELMKLLDDAPRERCHLIFLAQGAMSRQQTDKWVRLALIAEALRRHGRGRATRLVQVKRSIHRYLAQLIWAVGEERAHSLGEQLWEELLRTPPDYWRDIYNGAVQSDRRLYDDPVPKSVIRAIDDVHLKNLAIALEQMPIRASADSARLNDRLADARGALREMERALWRDLLVRTRWRSPLLVMDEAHHLKNPGTSLARQLQSPDLDRDLQTGDGAMARSFDRMLFLTATPFQLGHSELLNVLKRFADIRWDVKELGDPAGFREQMAHLGTRLNESQRSTIALQRCWGRLSASDVGDDVDSWWASLWKQPREELTNRHRAVLDAYQVARKHRDTAQLALRPWVVRHNKGMKWVGTDIARRQRFPGAGVSSSGEREGLPIPPEQVLPFFLAARSAVKPGEDLLGEALSSSYEAFRRTRQDKVAKKDEQDDPVPAPIDLSHARWYLTEFDRALADLSGAKHPKIAATVKKTVDLWQSGEKVLVFAFYRYTCRALRLHISREVERRISQTGIARLQAEGTPVTPDQFEQMVQKVQARFFDDTDSPGRRAVDEALREIVAIRARELKRASVTREQQDQLIDVMRRFLRVTTTLARCFPLAQLETMPPPDAVRRTLDFTDVSQLSWRHKFDGFIEFLVDGCSASERELYLEAVTRLQTGGIRVESVSEGAQQGEAEVTLANVQVATGETQRETRSRLMRAFNTPFFPDILVCSEVMGEGVDLQRSCRHVIHHDLAWNPSTIEQRTGRIDRLGCKAEGRHPIMVYLPYINGAADERQFRVMTDREQWFRLVMGQDDVAKLITTDSAGLVSLPEAVSNSLSFALRLDDRKAS